MNFVYDLVLESPIAAYAAIVSTLSFLIALPLAVSNYRRNRRERGLLRVQQPTAGQRSVESFRTDLITADVMNIGGTNVSILSFYVASYAGLLNIFLRRNGTIYEGDGWRLVVDHARLVKRRPDRIPAASSSVDNNMTVPFVLAAGDTKRLEIQAVGIWPDRDQRRVELVIEHSHSKAPMRVPVRPLDPWSYSDQRGILESEQALKQGEYRKFQKIAGEWTERAD